MTEYRLASIPGATWFFTVNLAERKRNRLLVEEVDSLRKAFRSVQAVHAFRVDAVVILPDHLHCIWTLPPGDSDFSTRWGLIKGTFSRSIKRGERVSPSRVKRGERGLWQRRFRAPCGLHSLEPGQAWLGTRSGALAPFKLSRSFASRYFSSGLGRRNRCRC